MVASLSFRFFLSDCRIVEEKKRYDKLNDATYSALKYQDCATNIFFNCDGSVEKHGDGTIDEIVVLVWDGSGLYEIESLVPGVYSIDTLCFDREGFKCELEDMFPDGMGWHDAYIRQC